MINKLEIRNLNFNYKNKKALDNINLTLTDGVVALLGPNGAGKSTLMRLLVTLYETSIGEIELNNIKYSKNNEKIKANVGYVPQDFDMYNNINGQEYLEFVAKMRGVSKNDLKKHIEKVVSKVNLDKFINKKIGTYSGGVKRRLGIAQALIGDSKLIVMDEPTVGLDPEQRNEFRRLLPEISKNSIVLISTHIVEDIQFNCDKLIILNQGKILYDGTINKFIDMVEVYSVVVSNDEFEYLERNIDIIDYRRVKDGVQVKYIGKNTEKLKDSLRIDTTLQDAYINFLHKELK
ncbi:ATP-binding cassette domain-containing protein [Clostridioides difficile]|uniref:ATP-binding cassette domain-containing protein n=1 Tax=Clostridioides difficile TaxID=1496 RepID=UPI00038D3F65|nr:ATP-binding cassette domain-containing protein [Clostridioides difficile]CCL66879.1 Abc transporter, atp-binding protein [Clostridioides difficile E7]EGT3751333.1 ATP-binding cassette domain-containing protein [Clostridioides difficile]EGT3869449.1 ATP-binding cassette domain-containing protein [Clostridioides difficile]EGT4039685.1 ATP-binding cassette domain-containing protein [Clostridioides difficile]EGT4149054.1 ATP-binding cassette domain-containing protein [Clostridioides difficile]